MKYMILTYGSQRDYDPMAGQAPDQPALSPEDFAPMGAFMRPGDRDRRPAGQLP